MHQSFRTKKIYILEVDCTYKHLFLLPNLAAGGAQRNMLNIISVIGMTRPVLLVVYNQRGIYKSLTDKLSKDVEIIYLKGNKYIKIYNLFKIFFCIRIKTVFTGLYNYNLYHAFLFSIILSKTTLILRETAVLSEMKMSYLKRLAYQVAMRRADVIISQSDDMTVDLIKNFNVDKLKVVQIRNPICDPKFVKANNSGEFFLIVGRLEKEKNILGFLKLLSLHKIKIPLTIIGEGSESAAIKSLINNDISLQFVKLLSYQLDLSSYFMRSKALILPSLVEGMPNIALEALSYGVPIISNNFKGGINEIINRSNGAVVDFFNEANIKYYFSDVFIAQFNPQQISNDVLERFSFKDFSSKVFEVYSRYEE